MEDAKRKIVTTDDSFEGSVIAKNNELSLFFWITQKLYNSYLEKVFFYNIEQGIIAMDIYFSGPKS